MGKYRQVIASFVTILMVMSITVPSALKLYHALYEHSFAQCKDANTLHIHKAECGDCIFNKFKHLSQFYFVFQSYDSFVPHVAIKINVADYEFLSNYQKLHFSLRAPPVFV